MLKGEIVIARELKEYDQINETEKLKTIWITNLNQGQTITILAYALAK